MPTAKRKAPPAPGAANALASALGVAKFTRIKPGELQHEVDVGRRFNIPGSYWGDQCGEGEENQMFAAKVVEVTLTHKFQGTSMRQPALRFVLTGAAAATVDETPLWIASDEYAKLTEEIRQTEKDDAAAEAKAATVAQSGIKTVTQGGGGDDDVEEVSEAEINRRGMRAPIFKYWASPVLLSQVERPHPRKTIDDGNGGRRPLMVAHFQWQFTCQELKPLSKGGDGEMKCLHQRIDWNGSNGNLFKHLATDHPELHEKLSLQSKHSSLQMVDGKPTHMMTFEERFPHHIMYTVETYLDYAPLVRCRKPGNRGVMSSLRPGYVPPCTKTQHQIMQVIDELEDEEIAKDIKRWRQEIGPGFLGEATDGLTSSGHHFVTFNGSVIEDEPLRMERFVLDYHEYSGSGDAGALAVDWKATEKRYGIIDSDRGRPTADGAAPQQKAIRNVTGKNGRKCANHQEARAALEAFKTKNPEAYNVIKKYRGLSRFARKSTMYKNDIRKHEKEVMLVSEPTQMVLPNETRWTGNISTLERTNEKEPAVRKLHTPSADDGTRTLGESSADALSSDDGSSGSESDEKSGDEEAPQPTSTSKNARKYRARVESKSLLASDWSSGKDLEACWRHSLEFIFFMQTQTSTTLEYRLQLARVLIVVNTIPQVTRLVMTKAVEGDGKYSYSREEEEINTTDLMPCASTFRDVYSTALEERFFSNDNIPDEDLIALMLNWATNYKATLGYNHQLIARAERVFSEALNEADKEIDDGAIAKRPSKKKKPLGSDTSKTPGKKGVLIALSRSEDYSAAPANDDDDDDEEVDDTTVDKFNKLRRLEGKARSGEIAKYLDDDGDFSLLRFLDKNRITLEPAIKLGQRIFI